MVLFFMTNPAHGSLSSPHLTGSLIRRREAGRAETAVTTPFAPLGEAALADAERAAYFRGIRREIDRHPDNEVLIAKFVPEFTGPIPPGETRDGRERALYDDFQIFGRMSEDGSFPRGSQEVAYIARQVLATPDFNRWMGQHPNTSVFASIAFAPQASMLVYRTTPELLDATGQVCRATYAAPVSGATAGGLIHRIQGDPTLADELLAYSSFANLFRQVDGVKRSPTNYLTLIDIPPTAYGAICEDPSITSLAPYMRYLPCETPAYVTPRS